MTTMRLHGHLELIDKLSLMRSSIQRRIVRGAVSKALTPVNKSAKKYVPTKTRTLRRSIGKSVTVYPRTATISGRVGPRKGFVREGEDFGDLIRSATALEYGSQTMAARPFLRWAFHRNQGNMRQIMGTEIGGGILRIARGGR